MPNTPMRYGEKWPLIAKAWDTLKYAKGREPEFKGIAAKAIANKERYQAVEAQTGVPWYLIAALHVRESSADFTKYLGNGEPLNRVTKLVPKGRGPFPTWEAGAIDALHHEKFQNVMDWRIEKVLYHAVIYNGLGYEYRKLPSPYVWGGTNHQKAGKFTSDGKFNGSVWDKQPGVAGIIKAIADADPSVLLTREEA